MARTGRPPKPIDWDVVERKMEAGCTEKEIIALFDIDRNNFYDRFFDEFGTNFTTYASYLHSIGDGKIRETQYEKALEGNTNMLILLGRERLGQGQEAKPVYTNEDINTLRHRLMLSEAKNAELEERINANKS